MDLRVAPRAHIRRDTSSQRPHIHWADSIAEGLALMRLAEALLGVPDAETAIALTADQLGRADFEGAADGALARLSQAAISMSKKLLPHESEPGLLGRHTSRP